MANDTTVDQRLNKIASGRQASLVAGLIKPLIDKKVDEHIHALVARHRAGDTHYESMIGSIAAISTLMGLMSELESTHKQGLNALERELKNA